MTVSTDPYIANFKAGDWDRAIEPEKDRKKEPGYA